MGLAPLRCRFCISGGYVARQDRGAQLGITDECRDSTDAVPQHQCSRVEARAVHGKRECPGRVPGRSRWRE